LRIKGVTQISGTQTTMVSGTSKGIVIILQLINNNKILTICSFKIKTIQAVKRNLISISSKMTPILISIHHNHSKDNTNNNLYFNKNSSFNHNSKDKNYKILTLENNFRLQDMHPKEVKILFLMGI